MYNLEWNDGIGSRNRSPFLICIKDDEVYPFKGEDIPGIVVVIGTDFKKNGKWSNTTYRLKVLDDVRCISGRDGFETGTFAEGLGKALGTKTPDTWKELSESMDVSVPSLKEFLQEWRPKSAEKFDEMDKQLEELEHSSEDDSEYEIITVGFGSPSKRKINEGYWEEPKDIPGYNAQIQKKDFSGGWVKENIEIVGICGTVLNVKHSRGMHGGTYAVKVAVIPGTENCTDTETQENLGSLGEALKKAGYKKSGV